MTRNLPLEIYDEERWELQNPHRWSFNTLSINKISQALNMNVLHLLFLHWNLHKIINKEKSFIKIPSQCKYDYMKTGTYPSSQTTGCF